MEQRSNLAAAVSTGRPTTLRGAWLALLGLSAVFLIEMLDTSVLGVALPTIATSLTASPSELQWASGSYALVFGGLMLAFGAIADRYGRRRVMLAGLTLFGLASLGVLLVTTPAALIAVRVLIGLAAAMTAPGSMALSFRLYDDDALRVRATALISTVGLIGLAIGPTVGGLVLAVAPWQALLLINVPVAILAFAGIRFGIADDDPSELRRVPIDLLGALLGTIGVILALLTPTLFVEVGALTPWPWLTATAAALALAAFVRRQRRASHPLIELPLLRGTVALGLAYQAALGLATAGLGYTVQLQLQLAWGWPPVAAALGALPQVLTMLVAGPLVEVLIRRIGMNAAGPWGSAAVAAGLMLYAVLGRLHYAWIAIALVLVAAGMRVVMITATINVMRGLPRDRTSLGAALNDTAQELAAAVGLAVSGTIIAAVVAHPLALQGWSVQNTASLQNAITAGTLTSIIAAAAMLSWTVVRARASARSRTHD